MEFDEELTLGEFLRRARQHLGLTQQIVAEEAGVSPGYLSGLENGRSGNLRPSTLVRLAYAYRVNLDTLADYNLPRSPDPEVRRWMKRLEWAFKLICRDPESQFGRLHYHLNHGHVMMATMVRGYEVESGRTILLPAEWTAIWCILNQDNTAASSLDAGEEVIATAALMASNETVAGDGGERVLPTRRIRVPGITHGLGNPF